MGETTTGRQVLVLSDDDSVARATEIAIRHSNGLAPTRYCLTDRSGPPFLAEPFKLIVLVLRSYDLEPVVALARASLAACVGRIPILVVSEKPFPSDPPTRIYHLGLPFTSEEINSVVTQILSEDG